MWEKGELGHRLPRISPILYTYRHAQIYSIGRVHVISCAAINMGRDERMRLYVHVALDQQIGMIMFPEC